MQTQRTNYEAFVLRLWFSDVEPHMRIMLKQLESGQTWHFTQPSELAALIEQFEHASVQAHGVSTQHSFGL